MIDSEQVPWGKGEKHPDEGGEIVPETIYLQRVGAFLWGDGVPIEEWANEFVYVAYISPEKEICRVKARVNCPFILPPFNTFGC